MKLESREVENSRGRPVEGPLLLQTCQDIVIDAQKTTRKRALYFHLLLSCHFDTNNLVSKLVCRAIVSKRSQVCIGKRIGV